MFESPGRGVSRGSVVVVFTRSGARVKAYAVPALLAACAFRAAKVDADSSVESALAARAIRAASQLRASRADYGALDPDARLALLDALVHACCETWKISA